MKLVSAFGIILAFALDALAEDKPKTDSRTTTERYLAAALAGKTDDAAALAVDGQSPSRKKTVEELKALINANTLKLPTVWADDKKGQAIAVTEEIALMKPTPDGQNKACVIFALVKTDGKWLIKDIDLRSKEKAAEQVESFKKRCVDAKELPAVVWTESALRWLA